MSRDREAREPAVYRDGRYWPACCLCRKPCTGGKVRHRANGKMADMLNDPAIPRLLNGGLALCFGCQRAMWFAGGFDELLVRSVEKFGTGSYYARIK